ncbi:MAG: zinc-dependent alcohol dehydrogenase family protein [Thermoplasmata archaeon YP2-bin.285]|uniref:Zinc-dependent alcohol dehydrogenase family protein n=1 Tax=Candidatus Sysuiplasma superficiale TaxID=2823368 RepID=A0A8J8CG41_9ARCH|nr:zinc-dependent alcohol dehydrogenase family protein [Candidatus Sysuiplasma superficiale]
MKAMLHQGSGEGRWLEEEDVPVPSPGPDEVLVKLETCGVCRTDLHIVEGDLPERKAKLIPGHEGVGIVVARGEKVSFPDIGDRVGLPWLHGTCGRCEFCISGRENLCREKRFTGYTVNGGFAEYATAQASYVIPVPSSITSADASPFLCSGIIGYRAFKLAESPPSGRLGLFGFGSSAHLIAQVAIKLGRSVAVISRGRNHLDLGLKLGADQAVELSDAPALLGGKLDAAIVFAPSGHVLKLALQCVKPGGTVTVPLIHIDSVGQMDYETHLFHERRLLTVEANTRSDAHEFMHLASTLGIRSVVTEFGLSDANHALLQMKMSKINGAAVLRII